MKTCPECKHPLIEWVKGIPPYCYICQCPKPTEVYRRHPLYVNYKKMGDDELIDLWRLYRDLSHELGMSEVIQEWRRRTLSNMEIPQGFTRYEHPRRVISYMPSI
jgi:hypothetical protein